MGNRKKQSNGGLPEDFLERLTALVGSSLFNEVKKTFVERPTTFRVNTLKELKNYRIKELLIEQGFQVKQIPWYKDAFVLMNKSKRELMETEQYIKGEMYVQSLASMVPPLVLDPKPGERVLDLTAAPGSKTSQIAALMERTGELVANDMDKVRFFKLQHNMELLGVVEASDERPLPHPPLPGEGLSEDSGKIRSADFSTALQVPPPRRGRTGRGLEEKSWRFVLRMEPGWKLTSEYPEGYFDKILLDAPCSAEARFIEGEPGTYGYWSERKIKEMVATQWRLLLAAWYALKPGGVLVYSTCTFAPEENEYQISKFMEKVGSASPEKVHIEGLKRLPIAKEWNGKSVNPEVQKCLRIMPTREIEGFFIAKIRKKE